MDLLHHSRQAGSGALGGGQVVIGQLGLAQVQLSLIQGGLGRARVHPIEQGPLLHPVPFGKGGL